MTRKWLALLLALAMVLMAVPLLAQAEEEQLEYAKIDWYIGNTPLPGVPEMNAALNEYLMEKINCEVNIIYLTGPDWEQQMGTKIASGEDLGIIGFGSQSKSDYVIESNRGAFYPLDDLLETYAPGVLDLFSEDIWDAMRINGNIYGIPSLKDNGYYISLVYNADMAEELGIDVEGGSHKNFRELEPLFREAKEKRDAAHPEWADRPIAWDVNLLYPYYFAFETFLNDSYLAVCNIEGIMDIAGADPETVVNFYETPEFLEFCLQKQQLVADGIHAYDYELIKEYQYEGSIFGYVGWGYTYMQDHLYSPNFVTKMRMADNIWTETNNYFSAGTAISANCKNPEQAMRVLNLVNTDPFVATMMRFGVEGVHWKYDDNGEMTFEGTANEDVEQRSYYYWYNAPVGNLTIVNAPESLIGPDGVMLTRMVELNNAALLPNHMGFVFDTTPVTNEIAACTNIVMEYQKELVTGKMGSQEEVEEAVAEFVEKLKANGADKIVAEAQSQIDAWREAKAE